MFLTIVNLHHTSGPSSISKSSPALVPVSPWQWKVNSLFRAKSRAKNNHCSEIPISRGIYLLSWTFQLNLKGQAGKTDVQAGQGNGKLSRSQRMFSALENEDWEETGWVKAEGERLKCKATEGQDKTGRNGIWMHIEWKLQDLWFSGFCDSLSRRRGEQMPAAFKAWNSKFLKGIGSTKALTNRVWTGLFRSFLFLSFHPFK